MGSSVFAGFSAANISSAKGATASAKQVTSRCAVIGYSASWGWWLTHARARLEGAAGLFPLNAIAQRR